MAEAKNLSPSAGSSSSERLVVAASAGSSGRTIVIPEEVARGIEDRIRTTSFPTVDAFAGFVLARLLEGGRDAAFTEEEERRLRERLRSLGYID